MENNINYLFEAKLKNGVTFKVDKSIFNEAYLPYVFDTSRVQIFFGGGSSGKSTFVFQTVPINMILYGRNYLVLTKQKKLSTTSCVNEVKRAIRLFGLEDYFVWRVKTNTLTCTLNNSQVYFEGLEDVENLKSIVPLYGSFTDVIIEEATNVSEADIEQLFIRQRGISKDDNGNDLPKRMYILFNPISKVHHLYKRYFLGKWVEESDKAIKYHELVTLDDGSIEKVNISILKTTYRDNKYLSNQDIATLLSQNKDPVRRMVYVDGFFGVFGKTIFEKNVNYFIEDGLKSRINTLRGFIRMGLDFSGGVVDHAFIKVKIDKSSKKIYVYDDFGMPALTMSELWDEIKPKAKGNGFIYCDHDDDKRKQLKMLGCSIKKAKKHKIVDGITYLKEFDIIIDSNCKSTIANFENYSWLKNRMGEYIEKPEDINNDHIDALRYAISIDMKGKSGITSVNAKLY